ncbi:hypothetical protein HN587_04590 [Candidatus Woesearchaeota archaeon]|jgi:hypothetical protein|nr:hypothetical protein [Candidatus Woesearchaeota archaeon]
MSERKFLLTLLVVITFLISSSFAFGLDCEISSVSGDFDLDWGEPGSGNDFNLVDSVEIPFKVVIDGKRTVGTDNCPPKSAPFKLEVTYVHNDPVKKTYQNYLYQTINSNFASYDKTQEYFYSGEKGFSKIIITYAKLKSLGVSPPFNGKIKLRVHYLGAIKDRTVDLVDKKSEQCIGVTNPEEYALRGKHLVLKETKGVNLEKKQLTYTALEYRSQNNLFFNGVSYSRYLGQGDKKACIPKDLPEFMCESELAGDYLVDSFISGAMFVCQYGDKLPDTKTCHSKIPSRVVSKIPGKDTHIMYNNVEYELKQGKVQCENKNYTQYINVGSECHCIEGAHEKICVEVRDWWINDVKSIFNSKETLTEKGDDYESKIKVLGTAEFEGTNYPYTIMNDKVICINDQNKKSTPKKTTKTKPKKIEVGKTINGVCRLDVEFDYNKAEPKISDTDLQDYLRGALAQGTGIHIYTFASPEGSVKKNLVLAEKRAQSIEHKIADIAIAMGTFANPMVQIHPIGEIPKTFSNNGFGSDRRAVISTESISFTGSDYSSFLPAPSLGSFTVDACMPPPFDESKVPEGVKCIDDLGCFVKQGADWYKCLDPQCVQKTKLNPNNPEDKRIIYLLEGHTELSKTDKENFDNAKKLLIDAKKLIEDSNKLDADPGLCLLNCEENEINLNQRRDLRNAAVDKISKARKILFELHNKFKVE